MQRTGVRKPIYALDPEYLPFVDGIRMSFEDLMHIEGSSGNINYEASQMFYMHMRVGDGSSARGRRGYYDYDDLVTRWGNYPFPPSQHVPVPLPSVIKGTKAGRPHSSGGLHWSASQAFHFALHSVGIIEPLLHRAGPDVAKNDGPWQSWLAHIAYVKLALSPHYSRARDLPEMSRLIQLHHERYQAVPEYDGFMKPKNHEALHCPLSASDGGPLRDLMTLAFERLNQSFKRMAEISNFWNVAMTLAEFWVMSSARELASGNPPPRARNGNHVVVTTSPLSWRRRAVTPGARAHW